MSYNCNEKSKWFGDFHKELCIKFLSNKNHHHELLPLIGFCSFVINLSIHHSLIRGLYRYVLLKGVQHVPNDPDVLRNISSYYYAMDTALHFSPTLTGY